jgi:hypothetical protein
MPFLILISLIKHLFQSVDKLIGYMSVNLKTLHDRMMTPIYYRMLEHLWPTLLTLLDQQMLMILASVMKDETG